MHGRRLCVHDEDAWVLDGQWCGAHSNSHDEGVRIGLDGPQGFAEVGIDA